MNTDAKSHVPINWRRVSTVFVCGVFVLVVAGVLLFVAIESLPHPHEPDGIAHFALPLLAVFVGIVTLASFLGGNPNTAWDVVLVVFACSVFAVPHVGAVLAPLLGWPPAWFFVSLAMWLLCGLIATYNARNTAWTQFLVWLGTASTVVAVLCELGLATQIPFATQAMTKFRAVTVVVDLRLAVGAVFAALSLLTATVRAFEATVPAWGPLPVLRVPPVSVTHTILAPLTQPFVVVTNGALLVAIRTLDVVLGFLFALLMRLLRVGWEFTVLIWQLLTSELAVVPLLKVLAAALTTYGAILAAFALYTDATSYLVSDTATARPFLPAVMTLGAAMLVAASVLAVLYQARRAELQQMLFGASLVVVLLLLAGALLYGVAATKIFAFSGFQHVGVLSIVGLGLLALGVGYALVDHAFARRRIRS